MRFEVEWPCLPPGKQPKGFEEFGGHQWAGCSKWSISDTAGLGGTNGPMLPVPGSLHQHAVLSFLFQGFISSSIFSFFFLIPSFHPLSYFTPFSLCYGLMAFYSLWWPKRKLVVMQGPNLALWIVLFRWCQVLTQITFESLRTWYALSSSCHRPHRWTVTSTAALI